MDRTELFNPFAGWFGSVAPTPEGAALDLLTTVSKITVVRDPPSPLLKPRPIGVFLVPVPQRADPPPPALGTNLHLDSITTRDVYGVALFSQKGDPKTGRTGIETVLNKLLLPLNSPLSVLAVELLPTNGPFDRPTDVAGAAPQDPQGTGPLDDNLGQQRILRTSTLTPVPPIC